MQKVNFTDIHEANNFKHFSTGDMKQLQIATSWFFCRIQI